jgi:cyclo(L-tyrosyl-L-tyrosyl) synthase
MLDSIYHVGQSKQTVAYHLVGDQPKGAFARRDHALIGMSPFQSFYTEERIYQWVTFAKENFRQYHFFLSDELFYLNFIDRGYSEKEAWHETRKQDRYLYNKTIRALQRAGILEPEKKILRYADFKDTALYQNYYQKYRGSLLMDADFQKVGLAMLSTLQFKQAPLQLDVNTCFNYFIAELPFLLHSAEFAGTASSCFIYRENNAFLSYIFSEKHLQEPNQGFVAVNFEDPL